MVLRRKYNSTIFVFILSVLVVVVAIVVAVVVVVVVLVVVLEVEQVVVLVVVVLSSKVKRLSCLIRICKKNSNFIDFSGKKIDNRFLSIFPIFRFFSENYEIS